MFEIAGGIILAYLVIRYRHLIAGIIIAIPVFGFSKILARREAKRFDRPDITSPQYLDWANREGVWRNEPEINESPIPPRHSKEYLHWANREGRWSED
jgi:hypothetical protein